MGNAAYNPISLLIYSSYCWNYCIKLGQDFYFLKGPISLIVKTGPKDNTRLERDKFFPLRSFSHMEIFPHSINIPQ